MKRRSYDFEWFKVRHLPRYGWTLDRAPAVVIVPIAPDDRLWLVQVRRFPTKTRSWEFPGGAIDGREDPLTAGLRELEEETGLFARRGGRLLRTAFELAPGMGKFLHRVVIARDVAPRERKPVPQRDEGIVAVRCFDRGEVRRMIRSGRISVGATLAVLTLSGWLERGA